MHLQLNEDQNDSRIGQGLRGQIRGAKSQRTDETQKFPTELVGQAAEMGFMGTVIPEQYGGSGLDCVSYCCADREVARHCGSTSVILSVNNSLACEPLMIAGTEAQKKEWLTPLASGQKLDALD